MMTMMHMAISGENVADCDQKQSKPSSSTIKTPTGSPSSKKLIGTPSNLRTIHLNRHPSINYFSSDSTPIPAFPKIISVETLRSAQKESDQLFFKNLNNPTALQPSTSGTPAPAASQTTPSKSSSFLPSNLIRLVTQTVNRESSFLNLPYPNPDLSIYEGVSQMVTGEGNPGGDVGKSEGHPIFEEEPDIAQIKDAIDQEPSKQPPSASQESAIEENSSPNHDSSHSPKTSNEAAIAKNHSTPAAALTSVLLSNDNQKDSLRDQVLAELQSRANQAPGIGKVVFGDENVAGASNDVGENQKNDRFSKMHGKQFAKYDSITNHYAAKRKNEQQSNPSNAKRVRVGETDENPIQSKARQQSSSQQNNAQDENDAAKKREAVRRQLEMARNRRKTNQEQRKSGRHQPSGFSSFGTRLLRSAVKTVKGAFMSSTASSSAKSQVSSGTNSNPKNVGFGVPAGLGVGPAKAPAAPGIPRKILPVRTSTVNNQTRLPPAGPPKPSIEQRRAISGPSKKVAPSSSLPARTLKARPRSTLTERATNPKPQPLAPKSKWLPKTLPKQPTSTAAAGPSNQSNTKRVNERLSSLNKNKSASKIPLVNHQNVIRTTRVSRAKPVTNAGIEATAHKNMNEKSTTKTDANDAASPDTDNEAAVAGLKDDALTAVTTDNIAKIDGIASNSSADYTGRLPDPINEPGITAECHGKTEDEDLGDAQIENLQRDEVLKDNDVRAFSEIKNKEPKELLNDVTKALPHQPLKQQQQQQQKEQKKEIQIGKKNASPVKLTKPRPFRSHFDDKQAIRKRQGQARISQAGVGKKRRSSGFNVGNKMNSHRVVGNNNNNNSGNRVEKNKIIRWR